MIGGVILVLMDALYNNKKGTPFDIPFLLSHLDSNQDKQNQNLLCYHYTMRQTHFA